MISFSVFPPEPDPAEPWRPRHAHLIGEDDRTVPGSIDYEDGLLRCHTAAQESAALVVQYPVGRAGVLTLQTTLLPAREQPYLLEIELARQCVMRLYGKLEDWWLCLLPEDNPLIACVGRARDAFLAAVARAARPQSGAWTEDQAGPAREALETSLLANEELASVYAEMQLTARYRAIERREAGGRTDETSRPPEIGCAVQNAVVTPALQQAVRQSASFITSPMRWREIEPKEGRFDLGPTDRWIEWAVREGDMGVTAGPVLDFTARAAPPWLYIWEHDYESIRDFAMDHAKRVVGRYRRAVSRWTAISGVNLNAGFSFTIDQMMELTRLATRLVHRLSPGVPALVEINHPFGEHPTYNPRSVPPFYYLELVHEADIEFEGLSIRFQMGDRETGRSTRDLMTVSHVLDIYAQFARPIHVTFGVPSAPVAQSPPMPPDSNRSSDDPPNDEHGGCWRAGWTPDVQAEWMARAGAVMLAKPAVRSITWQALYDTDEDAPEMPHGGLIDLEGRPKPALRRLAELRMAVEKRRVPTRVIPGLAPIREDQKTAPT